MKKDGLTLVELLAVIAIIAILAIMITPGIISIRRNVLESTYQTRVSQIENAAKDYASDHINLIPQYIPTSEILDDESFKTDAYKREYSCCATVSVNYLISSGYLAVTNGYASTNDQQKESQIINPLTGESMNNMVVCFRYTSNDAMNRDIVAFLLED